MILRRKSYSAGENLNNNMTEESVGGDCIDGSSTAKQRRNTTPMHIESGGENDVELLDLKAPAPTEPNYTTAEYEEMIQEYEDEILRLNKLNATLSANVAALYAENEAAEEELCHNGSDHQTASLGRKQTSMEISSDEPIHNEMAILEEQYLNEITKHQKLNNKLKKQLETQKKLVSKLSLHLKTSADKITDLTKEKDEWKAKAENSKGGAGIVRSKSDQETEEDQIHKYQIQVIHNELLSLQNLMKDNSIADHNNRQQMLNEYRNKDALWNSKLEQPMHTMERIIRSVTGDNGGVIDTPVVDHLEVKPVSTLEKKEDNGNVGFNVLDSVTSLFGQKRHEQKQLKIQVDEHPMSNEIKTFDKSRLKTTTVVAAESLDKLEQEEDNIDDERIKNDSIAIVSESTYHSEVSLNEVGDGDESRVVLEDEGQVVVGESSQDGAIEEDPNSSSTFANEVINMELDEEKGAEFDDECAKEASNVDEFHADSDVKQVEHEDDDISKDKSSDEESMYEDFDGNYVAREGKGGLEHSDNTNTDNKIDDESSLAGIVTTKNAKVSADTSQLHSVNNIVGNDNRPDGDEGNVILLPGPVETNDDVQPDDMAESEDVIMAALQSTAIDKEESALLDEGGDLENDQPCDEDKTMPLNEDHHDDKHAVGQKKQIVKSMSHYQNVILQYTSGECGGSTMSKTSSTSRNSLSRKQLFQQKGLSCADLFVDVVDDFFHGKEERKVLVESQNNGRDLVPPYEPPSIPPERKKDAPHYKRGAQDGYYVYKSSSGNEYSGHWKSGRRHGYGMAKYRDGEVFHGNWRRGRRHGHGVLHLANQDVFDGDWDTNQKHGLGVYYWADGEVDISMYEKDSRVKSVRWSKDRRLAYLLDLQASTKEPISLNKAAKIVREWEKKAEVFDC